MAKKPLDTTRLSDSRLKLVLHEMENRTRKMQMGLSSTFNDHINKLHEDHGIDDLQKRLRKTVTAYNDEVCAKDREITDISNEFERTKGTERDIITTKWDQKLSDLNAEYEKKKEAVVKRQNVEISSYLKRKAIVAEGKKIDTLQTKRNLVKNKITLINSTISSLSTVMNGRSHSRENYCLEAIQKIGGIDFASIKSKDTTIASKFFTDVAKAIVDGDRSKIEIVSIMDDLRANLICAGSSTGVESLVKSLPTASKLAQMSFTDLRKTVIASGNQLAQITAG